jgi:hypothetical protein
LELTCRFSALQDTKENCIQNSACFHLKLCNYYKLQFEIQKKFKKKKKLLQTLLFCSWQWITGDNLEVWCCQVCNSKSDRFTDKQMVYCALIRTHLELKIRRNFIIIWLVLFWRQYTNSNYHHDNFTRKHWWWYYCNGQIITMPWINRIKLNIILIFRLTLSLGFSKPFWCQKYWRNHHFRMPQIPSLFLMTV